MKSILYLIVLMLFISCKSYVINKTVGTSEYLKEMKTDLRKEWPKNKTINLVFHGHSVPAGYFKTPVVNTLGSYPFQVLKALKTQYPYAVINVINTSIGGENSVKGAKRFDSEVLVHRPDLLFIDYGLNDRSIGLEKAGIAWESMIRKALRKNIKVILLTPSPDQKVNLTNPDNELGKHALQIKNLAKKYGVGLADSYEQFHKIAVSGDTISNYMSQVNHPNEKGNHLIAGEIMKYFQ